MNAPESDFLVIGAGLAGLYAALRAADYGRVCLLTKTSISETNSAWAQGGIAAAVDENDSPQLHREDTLRAGRGLCDERAVDVLVREGPRCIKELDHLGVAFDRTPSGYELGREGGHSRRRIVHAGGSSTGQRVVARLSELVLQNPNIQLIEHTPVIELLATDGTCIGARVAREQVTQIVLARVTILATGGAAALYQRTTNPPGATGEGIALAYLAGAELADLEFIQFHPTALAVPGARSFLISEAVRGEGAYLLNPQGERFMITYDERAELAPRDIVARAIFEEMRKSKADHVFLSLRHLDPKLVRARFANIYETCLQHGLDITRDLIPVAPAAHYTIGGVRTDLWAETTVKNLFAIGEVSCTGVHGANRLASNSLLECLVFARRAVEAAVRHKFASSRVQQFEGSRTCEPVTPRTPELSWVKQLMTEHVGLVRDRAGLEYAIQELSALEAKSSGLLRDQALVARLIAQSALFRTETRGVHVRADFPNEDPTWQAHIIVQKDRPLRLEKQLQTESP
ncbi:MAG: L-aspartate oxidase [Candidatus Bipolaricaulota bacterium]|nr:L-aspartate oxidase [Candidatus Bipolaricaulota bacterium]